MEGYHILEIIVGAISTGAITVLIKLGNNHTKLKRENEKERIETNVRISVIEERLEHIDEKQSDFKEDIKEAINEIKSTQNNMAQDIKKLIKRKR